MVTYNTGLSKGRDAHSHYTITCRGVTGKGLEAQASTYFDQCSAKWVDFQENQLCIFASFQ